MAAFFARFGISNKYLHAVTSSCCKCNEEWSCFWDMEVDLDISAYFESNSVQLDEAQQLRFFEERLEFK